MPRTLLARCAAFALAAGAIGGCGVADDPLPNVKDPTAQELNQSGSNTRAQLPSIALRDKNKGGDKGKHGNGDNNGKNGSRGGNGGGNGGGGGGNNDGGGNKNDGGGGGGPEVRGPKTTRNIRADASGKLQFNTSDLWAPPGRVTITLTNPSSVLHGIAIAGANGINSESKGVGKGGKASVTATLPAGDYEFYCPVDGHREDGMSGILSVGNLPRSAR